MMGAPDVLSKDPTAGTVAHLPDDRFVPIGAVELAGAIARDSGTFGPGAAGLLDVHAALCEVIEQEARAFERELLARYELFDPDRETLPQCDLAAVRSGEAYDSVWLQLEYLLEKANFEPLDDVSIGDAMRLAHLRGLSVRLDPDSVQRFSLWIRGPTFVTSRRRSWRSPLRGKEHTHRVFRRVAVIARLRDDPHVLVKLFKDIPVADIEALLPHARVQMTWFDRLKVVGGSGGVLVTTATKVFKLFTTLWAFSHLLWVLLAGAFMISFRAILGYRRALIVRDSQRTRHLYYQNLDNNAGAIHRLISKIAEEELKEVLLVYAFCAAAHPPLADGGDLRDRIECYLLHRFGARVDFDFVDGIETMTRLDLWLDAARFRVRPPDETVRLLHAHWRDRRSTGYHAERAAAFVAAR